MSGELILSAVLPLIVGLFNVLAGGYALVAGREDKRKLSFALGPLGVGAWALAWFVSVFNPSVVDELQVLGGLGGVIALSGFAYDALLGLERRARALLLVLLTAATVVGATIVVVIVVPVLSTSLLPILPRLIGLALLGTILAAYFTKRATPDDKERRFNRRILLAITLCVSLYLILAVAALADARIGVDPLLLVVLVAESLALLYIVDGRIEVQILLSHAITYAILALAVAFVAALIFKLMGGPINLVLLAVTVMLALFSSIMFMALGELMPSLVERTLFPERARLTRALSQAKEEAQLLRRRLDHAERLAIAGELAASVAHEIKNPLSPIKGYAQLLAAKLDQVDEADRELFERGLAIIQKETDRIDTRVAELLNLGRTDRLLSSAEERFDLPKVVAECVSVAEGEPGISAIRTQIDHAVGLVQGNEDEIRGAIVNLLKNAAEAMAGMPDAEIEVVARPHEDQIVLEVLDRGVGVGEEEAERIFEAFYTTKAGGTGLGMAIARSAVRAAGGELTLKPRADGRGAVARMLLVPVELDEPTTERSAPLLAVPAGGAKEGSA